MKRFLATAAIVFAGFGMNSLLAEDCDCHKTTKCECKMGECNCEEPCDCDCEECHN